MVSPTHTEDPEPRFQRDQDDVIRSDCLFSSCWTCPPRPWGREGAWGFSISSEWFIYIVSSPHTEDPSITSTKFQITISKQITISQISKIQNVWNSIHRLSLVISLGTKIHIIVMLILPQVKFSIFSRRPSVYIVGTLPLKILNFSTLSKNQDDIYTMHFMFSSCWNFFSIFRERLVSIVSIPFVEDPKINSGWRNAKF